MFAFDLIYHGRGVKGWPCLLVLHATEQLNHAALARLSFCSCSSLCLLFVGGSKLVRRRLNASVMRERRRGVAGHFRKSLGRPKGVAGGWHRLPNPPPSFPPTKKDTHEKMYG